MNIKRLLGGNHIILRPEENKEANTHMRQVLPIRVNGSAASEMATENKPGKTELNTLENGQWVKRMAKANSFT